MAMKERLQEIIGKRGATKEGLDEGIRVIADIIAEKLNVKPEEVAILLLTSTGNTLKFVWPPALAHSSSVLPSDHRNAVAATVLASKRGKVDNKISESKHLKFFENVRGMETSGLPIQKMVALPLMSGPTALGVLEVSRKAKTPDAAGPDFTPEDAQALVGITREASPLLAKLIPNPFL